MNSRNIRNIAKALSSQEEHSMTMDMVYEMKVVIYGQGRCVEMFEACRIVSDLSHSSVPSPLKKVEDSPGLLLEFVYSLFPLSPCRAYTLAFQS